MESKRNEERGPSGNVLANSNDESQDLSVNVGNEGENWRKQQSGERSSLRRSITVPTQSLEPRLNGRSTSVNAGRSDNAKAASAAGGNSRSSGLPLPNQLSRSSSLRQPRDSVTRIEAARTLHSRYESAAAASGGGRRVRTTHKASPLQAQEDSPLKAELIPPRKDPSTLSKSVASHQRSQSSGLMLENGTGKAFSGAQNRFTAGAKPQFSTYQQQFSAREPKRQDESINVPSSTPHVSADLRRLTVLQDELLQLQWMFLSSHNTLQRWTESGSRKIDEQHRNHIREASNVMAIEQSQQNRVNGGALWDWLGRDRGKPSSEKIESLAQCVQTLTDLTRSHERLSRVFELFEAWYESVVDTLHGRSGGSHNKDPQFIQSLGRPWIDTVAVLVHPMESCLRELQVLGSDDRSSGLGLVLDAHRRFTKNTLDELTAMKLIHVMVLDQEDHWIKCRVSALLLPANQSELVPCISKPLAAWERVP